ncbi:MAG: SIR2 family protein [Defluviitaleaceae bacterium]|nr:SIR2 family protein [Defluviitaleaceae bacterium]
MATVQEFKREYSKAVSDGYAAVFAGAGLSRSSGYVDWKELVRPLADDINLDIDKEYDLISIAQYHVNEKRNRNAVEQRILNEFTQEVSENENVKIITRLPISTYWTTNYDELIENSLKANNRKADIKIDQESLAINIYDRDAVVYKMHGDVRSPKTAVITKDDYEMYQLSRPLFRTALQGDLITKTFLFIGFSFTDPNLNYVLSQIRGLLGESSRQHYCLMKKIVISDYDDKSKYDYEVIRQKLRIEDLRRYGILVVEIDDYSEITSMLLDIEKKHLAKSVFISGSCSQPTEGWTVSSIDSFAYSLSKMIVGKNLRIVSGFGLGIGSSVINGALEEIMSTKYKHVNEHLCLRPFPQNISDPKKRERLWGDYRKNMISEAGISVFMFGNKEQNGEIVDANGMITEFETAKALGNFIVPIASTGGSTAKIYDQMYANKSEYPYLANYWESLKSTTECTKLVALVIEIIDNIQKI